MKDQNEINTLLAHLFRHESGVVGASIPLTDAISNKCVHGYQLKATKCDPQQNIIMNDKYNFSWSGQRAGFLLSR